ncbi:hypothetical protein JKP88DRAFT_295392 [Tribonema minus]|uniref:Uncharacterized protein n=1 Tax=Tribonema minus TaxID=303371 RepID=A0A836CNC2_9STRA|nr:hypothetical protein JKP88DRAFT_295392 [Tribonema minus]
MLPAMRRLAQAIAVQAIAILLAILAFCWSTWPQMATVFTAITDALGVTTAVEAASPISAASTSMRTIETKDCQGFYWTTCRTILREEEIAADVVQPEDVAEQSASLLSGIIALAIAGALGCLLLYLVVRHMRKAAEPVPVPAAPCAQEKTALELLADGVQRAQLRSHVRFRSRHARARSFSTLNPSSPPRCCCDARAQAKLSAEDAPGAALRSRCEAAARDACHAMFALHARAAADVRELARREETLWRGHDFGYNLQCMWRQRSVRRVVDEEMEGAPGNMLDGLHRALAMHGADVAHALWHSAHTKVAAGLHDPTAASSAAAAAAVVDVFCRSVSAFVQGLGAMPPVKVAAMVIQIRRAVRYAPDRVAAAALYAARDAPERFAHAAFAAAVLQHPLRSGGRLDRAAVWFDDPEVGRMRVADGNIAWLDTLAARAMPMPAFRAMTAVAAAAAAAVPAAPAAGAAAVAAAPALAAAAPAAVPAPRPSAVLQLRDDTKSGGSSGSSGSSAAPLVRHSLMSPLGSSAASLVRQSPTSPRRRNRVTEPRRGD